MSFEAWAASSSAYTLATSGRIVPSSSSRAILPSLLNLEGNRLYKQTGKGNNAKTRPRRGHNFTPAVCFPLESVAGCYMCYFRLST
jgi:hypothetical protein